MTAPNRDTRYFVAHMQKTAGTSLRDRLRATFDEAEIYPNRTDGTDPRVAVISVRHLLDRWAVRGDEIRLLTGHFPVSTADLIDADFVTMTVLREPVDRTLSFLRHQGARKQRGADASTPLIEMYEDPFRFGAMIQNHMTRMLSLSVDEMAAGDGVLTTVPYTRERLERAKETLAALDLFGLQECFDEFCTELQIRYGLDVGPPLRMNATEQADAPAGLAERIADDNALDVELYDYARRLYEQRRARPQHESHG
jgi:hypothetical protein